jgi:putative transposase
MEVEGQTGVAYGEKKPERLAERNGYRDRMRRCGRTSHPN